MKDIEYNRLIALLMVSNEPAIMECLKLIQDSTPRHMVGEPIPANEVWDIYSKRKVWNESGSNPQRNRITGYDLLMVQLPKSSDQKVRIHALEWRDVTVMIFTDEKIDSLFGSLRSPKN